MDPLQYLFGLEKFGITFGLETTRALCAALDGPQNAYRSLLVAGTNGKGSVVAMVERALRAAGLRTGRYTSPHLSRIEERFVIDGTPVDEALLQAVVEDVRRASGRLMAGQMLAASPTFFEVATVVAFELFRRSAVDMAVLEVGMGGRFDATNVATPCATAITGIDLDHERHLGRTIAEIAVEKAGIIKQGQVVVSGERKREASEVISNACRRVGATLVQAHDGVQAAVRLHDGVTRLTLCTDRGSYGDLSLALQGRHQADNAVVAVRLLESLTTLGLHVSPEAITAGLTRADWPGRLERIETGDGRALILDSAHNPAGACALAAYVSELHPGGLPFVFAAMQDKDAGGMIAALAPIAKRFVMTRPSLARAADPSTLADLARQIGPDIPVAVEPDVGRAVDRALDDTTTAVAAGSIFLVGEIRTRLARAAARRGSGRR